ncbi:MAG TPA: ankyrin repeat domain-containing protein [Pyrinomonadaceae bacterium]|nr:ankyrin repeat domain-containing protein [Pyrinomonadaceae bacterium]
MSRLDQVITAIYARDLKKLETFDSSDLNLVDEDDRTPLMHAVLAENADHKIVNMLIERGADVNAEDAVRNWTALQFAAQIQRDDIVKTLLENGASVDPVDTFGNSPLWVAVMNASSNLDVVRLLVQSGADPNRKNQAGVAPIDIAKQSGRNDILAVLQGDAS